MPLRRLDPLLVLTDDLEATRVPAAGLRQLVLTDPNGVRVEVDVATDQAGSSQSN